MATTRARLAARAWRCASEWSGVGDTGAVRKGSGLTYAGAGDAVRPSWLPVRGAHACGTADRALAGSSALHGATTTTRRRGRVWARAVPSRGMFIQTQTTPNANSVKFVPGEKVLPPAQPVVEFQSLRDAGASPLARRLLLIDGVSSVFFGEDFVTVTKQPSVEWPVLRPEVFEAIMEHYASGEPVLGEGEHGTDDCAILPDDSEVVAMIKELLDTRVKPAVAEDGGNILFCGFDEDTGVVELELQGACSSCSSSSITLKMGVENMLKHYVPEVKEVREVKSAQTQQLEEVSERAMSDLESRLRNSGYIRD